MCFFPTFLYASQNGRKYNDLNKSQFCNKICSFMFQFTLYGLKKNLFTYEERKIKLILTAMIAHL